MKKHRLLFFPYFFATKYMLISEYSGVPLNTVYKDAENVVPMENEELKEKNTWRITRKYRDMFSCEDAVSRLIENHRDTEERRDEIYTTQ